MNTIQIGKYLFKKPNIISLNIGEISWSKYPYIIVKYYNPITFHHRSRINEFHGCEYVNYYNTINDLSSDIKRLHSEGLNCHINCNNESVYNKVKWQILPIRIIYWKE